MVVSSSKVGFNKILMFGQINEKTVGRSNFLRIFENYINNYKKTFIKLIHVINFEAFI